MEERTCFEDGEGLRILEMDSLKGVRSGAHVKITWEGAIPDADDHHIQIFDVD